MRKGTVCFLQKDNKVLLALIEYAPDDKKWNGIGGFAEEGESLDDTVIREAQEEINILIDKKTLKHVTTIEYQNVELHVYTADQWDGEPQLQDPTLKELRWFAKDNLPYSQMHEGNNVWLPNVLKGITYTWIKTNALKNFSPITQVYGICFNEKYEILICRKDSKSAWQLPGGKPESNELLSETLKREFTEEVNITIKNIQPLGVQKVLYPDNPNSNESEVFYQARMVCEVDAILEPTIDPDLGVTWERMFVRNQEITRYIQWGTIGKAMFNDAINMYLQNNALLK